MQSQTKFLHGKKRPTKERSRFSKSGIPVTWENSFSYKQILIFFNRILSQGEISLNRGPHFAGMFFLQEW